MKTIQKPCHAEIVEKKSKFICNLYNINSREEAEEIIKKTKKEYYDARHNCSAYSIYNLEQKELITKINDDGEPSGTAGAPIYNALKSSDLINVLAIVTRYFGGILLGTGGLVRAYNEATQNAIKEAEVYNIEPGYLLAVEIDYNENERFKFFCKKNNINIIKTEYLNNIKYILEINEENMKKLINIFRHNNTKVDIICQKMIKTA